MKEDTQMRIERIKKLIGDNREIEFDYKDKRYSITYFDENRKSWISFCEFYQEPIDVLSPDELLKIKIDGITLEEILSNLPNSAFDIY